MTRCVITQRRIESGDAPLLFDIYASTRASELASVPWSDEEKAAFLRMQFDAQHRHYQEHYRDAAFDIVLVDGQAAGRLYVARGREEFRIVDIALLPPWRNRGIGARVIGALQQEATDAGVRITIHVERFNPARSLYDRLGFRPIDEHGVYLLLEWTPDRAQQAAT
jgi:GNAT superfamily N-acetyltransferase